MQYNFTKVEMLCAKRLHIINLIEFHPVSNIKVNGDAF